MAIDQFLLKVIRLVKKSGTSALSEIIPMMRLVQVSHSSFELVLIAQLAEVTRLL